MKQLWLIASIISFAGIVSAQAATQTQGPVVAATDDRPVAASDEDEGNADRFYFGAGVGGMRIHRPHSPKPGSPIRSVQPYLILRVGYDFADSPWSVEGYGMLGHVKSSTRVGGDGENILGAGLEALYHFDRYAAFDPYIALGAGYLRFSGNKDWQDAEQSHVFAQAGVGAFWHLTENFSLRGDIRYHVALADDYIAYTTADLGVTYFMGEKNNNAVDNVAPLSDKIEEDARAYDEASEHSATLVDVTPEGSVDEMKLELRLQYAKDTSIIEPANYPALDELLRIIKLAFEANPEVYVTIDGHADRQHGSSHAYNQELSEARAKSVLTYLSTNGVPANRMKAAGHSFDQPKDPVNLDEGTPSNRRTEIVIRGVDEATRAKIRAAK